MRLFGAAYDCPAIEGTGDAEGPASVGVLAGYCCRAGVADETSLACRIDISIEKERNGCRLL